MRLAVVAAALTALLLAVAPGRGANEAALWHGRSAAYWGNATHGQVRARRERERTIRRLQRSNTVLLAETVRLRRQLASLTGPGAWQSVFVTSYATWEFGGYGLTGCRGHVCYTGCPSPWGTLDDWAFTVADNALACGTRIVLSDGVHAHVATVTDRTGSSYDMELSYALSRVFGAPDQVGHDLTWSGHLEWRPA